MKNPLPFLAALLVPAALGLAAVKADDELAGQLRSLDGKVLPADRAAELTDMLARDVRTRLREANVRENRAWQQVRTRADWEKYRDTRLQALRKSLGQLPPAPGPLKVRVTGKLEGDGYRIENLVFESRPGLVVTATLYAPARPGRSMPGILIAHSHHSPKTQGELQDMGMTWARQGCVVLVPDHLGHGERRQHPFRSAADYPRPFKVGRQDYYFRHSSGLQLQLAGESLMGWLVADLRRGVDLLLSRPGVDKERIILLGSVAGGGDPAAVTAALDPRVKAVVPFNFGGPQPDYGIPANAERDFYYFGVPDWESTRSLRLGARDGFAQWLIVAAVAPRRLVYAHEFAWDRARDPVWPRLQQVFRWYDASDRLAVAFGQGNLKGSPPASSHCNNIGSLHRSRLYPALKRWFDMPIPEEYSRRRKPEELLCLTKEAARDLKPRPLHELVADMSGKQVAAVRQRLTALSPRDRRQQLRQTWARLLGEVRPKANPRVVKRRQQPLANGTVERLVLEVEPGIVVPVVLLLPARKPNARLPVVIGLAQEGKQAFLRQRPEILAGLLRRGVAVCLPDVRGTGETRPADGSRRRGGTSATVAATEGLLGQTLVGARLRDLRSVLRYLRTRPDLDAGRTALWGDSFAPPNARNQDLAVPLDAEPFPYQAEPLGALLALFGALFEEDVHAVYVRGGLAGYHSLLQSPFVYVPDDVWVPGALTAGDLADVAAALAPRPLRLEGLVDGLNRVVLDDALVRILGPTRAAYRALKAESALQMGTRETAEQPVARWLVRGLAGKMGP